MQLYIQQNEEFIPTISSPPSYLEFSSEVQLINKLHKFKLLPEKYRLEFVKTVNKYALSGQNLHVFQSKMINDLFTKQELEELRKLVTEGIISKIVKIRVDKEDDFDSSQDPEQHMRDLVDVLDILENEFSEEPTILEKAMEEKDKIKAWVENNQQKEDVTEREKLSDEEEEEEPNIERSIFDDVDSES